MPRWAKFIQASAWALAALAQEPAPIGLIQGEVIEGDARPLGEIAIRTASLKVYRFHFDQRTYVEREKQRIATRALRAGDLVEVLSDRGSTPATRYARMVHVLDRRGPPAPARLPLYRSPTEHFAPRGTLTFSGVVVSVTPESLLLRTRQDGDKVILRREDTRYLESGGQVESSRLEVNTRVFVRAGRNGDQEIEAFQVVWGEILEPLRRH